MRSRSEMVNKITAITMRGVLDGMTMTFTWGSSVREYTVSNFRYERGDVYFRQETNDGMDDHDVYCLCDINVWFMESLFDNIIKQAAVDRNLF